MTDHIFVKGCRGGTLRNCGSKSSLK